MEKKQLLVISKNEHFIQGLNTPTESNFHLTSVQNIQAGYTLALSHLPDAILIDYTSLESENIKNLQSFKSSHFLNKSFLFLYAQSDKKEKVENYFRDNVDDIIYDSVSTNALLRKIDDSISVKHCLTNYWKDSFLGLFNLLSYPVILLQNEKIVAMNDSFKKVFFVTGRSQLKLTDIVNTQDKFKMFETMKRFGRGKHMRSSLKANLLLMNCKEREAVVTFTKLDKDLSDQMVMMINFTETGIPLNECGSALQNKVVFGKTDALRGFSFTKREKEIISLLCKGYKTKEISEVLCISSKTIEKHRSNIIKRTNSDTMLESIVYALNHKLIEI